MQLPWLLNIKGEEGWGGSLWLNGRSLPCAMIRKDRREGKQRGKGKKVRRGKERRKRGREEREGRRDYKANRAYETWLLWTLSI